MKKVLNTVSAQTKSAIRSYIDFCEKFKNAYFFTPPSNASSRRSYENKNSFSYKGDGIELDFDISCSARNVYVKKHVYINGDKKTAAALKKYL